MVQRTLANFLRWVNRSWPVVFDEPVPGTMALVEYFRQAQRTIATRVALACARECLVTTSDQHTALVLAPEGLAIDLPLEARGCFGLHPVAETRADHPLLQDPGELLCALAQYLPNWSYENLDRVRAELEDATFNLALARLGERHTSPDDSRDELIRSEQCVTGGHPWHPMAKTRLGLSLRENLRHAPELCGVAQVSAVDIAPDLWSLHSVSPGTYEHLTAAMLGTPRPGWLRVPTLAFQRKRLARLIPQLWGNAVVPAAVELRGHSLLSLRTVEVGERRTHLKLAMDVLTTSARRVVSPMSRQNGPMLSNLLTKIAARDPHTRSTLEILPDLAAAGLSPRVGGAARMLGVIVRPDPRGLVHKFRSKRPLVPSIWVCAALTQRRRGSTQTYFEHLADTFFGATPRQRARQLLRAYTEALLPPLLRLCCIYGIALEAHLQNMMVVHAPGEVLGFIIRDLGGIRLLPERLARAGFELQLAEGSFLVARDHHEYIGKLIHTLLHAHLGSVVATASRVCGVDPRRAWTDIRHTLVSQLEHLEQNYPTPVDMRDRAAILAPRHRAKALFAMRLVGRSVDYHYTWVDNPLNRVDTGIGVPPKTALA